MLKKIIFMIVVSSYTFASFTNLFSSDKIADPIIEVATIVYEQTIKSTRGSKYYADGKTLMALQGYYDHTTRLIIGECIPWRPDDQFYRLSMHNGELAADLAIAYKEIQKQYCGKLAEYKEYFEKKILHEFNNKYDTDFSIDDFDGTSEIVNLGIQKDEIPLWEKNGFTKKDIKEWGKAKVITLNEALEWIKHNFSVTDVSIWKANGILTPESAMTLISAGFTEPFEIRNWKDAGVTSPEEIAKWSSLGIKYAQDKRYWLRHPRIKNVDDVAKWVKAGVRNVTELESWEQLLGVTTVEGVLSWKAVGANSPYEAYSMESRGVKPKKI